MRRSILLITKDQYLPKHLKKLGSVICVKRVQEAEEILAEEDFDLVVAGPPYKEEDVETLEFPAIKIIKEPADLRELQRELQHNPETKFKRKIRAAQTDEIPYEKAKGTVLLATTDRGLIRRLRYFNIRIATNKYSAGRLLSDINYPISLVVWDLPEEKPKIKIPAYIWGREIFTEKDVYMLLVTGRLSLETEESKK